MRKKVRADRSFELENEEIRNRDSRRHNVIKRYGVNNEDEVFYVGSLDLLDPNSGKPIYVPSKQQLEDMEFREKEAAELSEDFPVSDNLGFETEYEMDFSIDEGSKDSTSSDAEVFDSSSMSAEDLDLANEIYARLMAEAAADEAAKQAEIEAIRRETEAAESEPEVSDADFNAATGSYSGLYGKKPMSQSESDALESILNTNSSYTKSIEELIAENQ